MQHNPKITALTLTLSGFIFPDTSRGEKIHLTDNLSCSFCYFLKDDLITVYRVFFNDVTEIGILKVVAGRNSVINDHQLTFYEDCLYTHCTSDFFLTLLAGLYKNAIDVRIANLHLGTFTTASFGLTIATAYQERNDYLPVIKKLPRDVYRSGNLYVAVRTMFFKLSGKSEYLYSCGLSGEHEITVIEVRPTKNILRQLAPVDLTVFERLQTLYVKEAVPFEQAFKVITF